MVTQLSWPILLKTALFGSVLLLGGCYHHRSDFQTVDPQAPAVPQLFLHENYIRDIGAHSLTLAEPLTVLEFLLSHITSPAIVYPTENYYYFQFHHAGQLVKGSFQLVPELRESGRVVFGYYFDSSALPEAIKKSIQFTILGPDSGIVLTKIDDWSYDLKYGSKALRFVLNQHQQFAPPYLAPDEEFIMRTFDDSGYSFFMIYRPGGFRFIMDESVPRIEELAEVRQGLYLGLRSGFFFFEDPHLRKVLVGVSRMEERKNTVFDGPFDQLADNYLSPDSIFKDRAERVYPSISGKINFRGLYTAMGKDSLSRLSITPYVTYERFEDFLEKFYSCSKRKQSLDCLTLDETAKAIP